MKEGEEMMKIVAKRRRVGEEHGPIANASGGVDTISVKEENQERPWADLPHDLMSSIMLRLFYGDHINILAVCKGWRSMYRVPPLRQLPWLMAFNEDSWTSCKLFDPVHKKTYQVEIADGGKGLLQGKNLKDIEVHVCKHGWSLMSEKNNSSSHNLFLYSPFANGIIINLPPLKSTFDIATFSSCPTISDCVFFVLNSGGKSGLPAASVCISVCCLRKKVWITRTFECDRWYGFCNVIFLGGSFYCVNDMGRVGIYNVAQQHWTMLQLPDSGLPLKKPQICIDRNGVGVDIHMIESSGEILIIYTAERYFGWTNYSPWHFVFKLNRLKRTWDSVHHLNDQVLFLGNGGCDVSLPAAIARRSPRTRYWDDRIYRCWQDRTKWFTLKAEKSKPCVDRYGSLSKEKCNKLWIEPPKYGVPTCNPFR